MSAHVEFHQVLPVPDPSEEFEWAEFPIRDSLEWHTDLPVIEEPLRVAFDWGNEPEMGSIFVALYASDLDQTPLGYHWKLYVHRDGHYGYTFALSDRLYSCGHNEVRPVCRPENDIYHSEGLISLFHIGNIKDTGLDWMFQDLPENIMELQETLVNKIATPSMIPADYRWILANLETLQQHGVLDASDDLTLKMSQMHRYGQWYAQKTQAEAAS